MLKLGNLHQNSYGSTPSESFQVEAITLDEFFGDQMCIDVLQIDVQGAELLVLGGASKLLKKTKAIFTEISVKPDLYKGAALLDEIHDFLVQSGFCVALMGTDFNLTGNALYINKNFI